MSYTEEDLRNAFRAGEKRGIWVNDDTMFSKRQLNEEEFIETYKR